MSEKLHPRARTSAPPRIEISNQTLVVWVPGTSITAPGAGVKPCIFRVRKPEWDYLSTTAMLTPTPNEVDTSSDLKAPIVVDYRAIIAGSVILDIDAEGPIAALIQQIEDLSFLQRLRGFMERCKTPLIDSGLPGSRASSI
jgi:hypothetical protein